ncbi:hypothetical protein Q3C01_08675 [Bradyrhizobium sp. UFLA05-109]
MVEDETSQTIRATLEALIVAFEKDTRDAIAISESRIGVDHTGRQDIALFIFAKLIAHCMSMRLLLRDHQRVLKTGGLLDHFSLATLGRAALDAAVMTMYISDTSINREQWDLRRQILRLHELFNRSRFLTAAGAESQTPRLAFFDTYEERKVTLRARINGLAKGVGYSQEKIEAILKGQNVFIDGVRGAAREAGWDVDAFDFHQTYLSNWVHSHPVSFLRSAAQGISFSHPSDYQLNFCGTVLEITMPYLLKASARMLVFTGSKDLDPIGQLD